MDDVMNISGEAQEAKASEGRPTLMGTQHGSRLFCARCGAHNALGWVSCFNCGVGRPVVSNGHRYAAALGAAMVSAAAFLMMWRLAHVDATCVVMEAPAPTATAVMLAPQMVVTTPVEVTSEQVTVVQQYPGGSSTSTSYTCRTSECTGTVYARTISNSNGRIVEYRRDVVEETSPSIVAHPVEGDSYMESSQPVLAPSELVTATTGGNRRQ